MPPPQASTPLNARATPSPFDRNHDLPHLRNGKGRQYDQSNTSSLSHEQVEGLRRQSNLSTLSLSPRRPSFAPSAAARTRRTTPLPFSTGADADESSFLGQSVDEGAPWTMVDRMRNWRNDAMTQHLYDSAKFWGGKVLGMTGNADDAFWLAQIHFLTHQFAQAERILTSPHPPSAASTSTAAPVRLTDMSLACRYLAAQCQVRLGKWDEALDMVGRRGGLGQDFGDGKSDGGIKLTASAAHLRGLIHLHMKANELAKEAFMEALSRDVKCFESFEMLVGGEMMSSEEEWDFIQGLPYHAQTEEDAEFIRMMYTLSHSNDMTIARQRLSDEYGLGDDPDVLCSRADELHSSMRYAECYKITSHILARHPSHRPTLPLHLSCMHHLPNLRSRLFLFAHDLVENEPDDAISWYAVGLWYFAGKRWEESRRFFGKSVLIDPRFGPAWLAYAHSFAYEGEHDQAITAYSTAQRHLPGSHLPMLFIGMQHLGLANVALAEEYLLAAKEVCKDDPLVLNELGVVALHNQQFDIAVQYFRETLGLARHAQSSPASWVSTQLNLAHAYRKLKQYDKAYPAFRRVVELDSRCAAGYSGLGIVEHMRGNFQDAIARYHEALSISPGDPITCDLLKLALDEVSAHTARNAHPFPGLPPRVLQSLDEQVAALDAEILAGFEPEPLEGERSAAMDASAVEEGMSRSEDMVEMSFEGDEDEDDGDEGEGETMDMTGE
ncbi:anaphase promoting complex subunit CDC16 [Rhodotorula paludigena]|uniref:anaphase promoting complex subunit CDC16 n=1 Tax=Rhodotorula paludigena TaxID=86838 RepID=UPI00317F218D